MNFRILAAVLCCIVLNGFAAAPIHTFGARGTVTPEAPMYGGFTLEAPAAVHILVRGPSLATLNIAPNPLDLPLLRVYSHASNHQGTDWVRTPAPLLPAGSYWGTTGCDSARPGAPVYNYYRDVRQQPADLRDTCVAMGTLPAGVYTFTVETATPAKTDAGIASMPASGEVLFEATLEPGDFTGNKAKTEQLLGGTWTLTHQVGAEVRTNRYTFTSVGQRQGIDEWVAYGTSAAGGFRGVSGWFNVEAQVFRIFDPNDLSLQFDYTFTFSDINHVSGCVKEPFLGPPGNPPPNLPCHDFTGVRSPPR
jgi:hypothetical protein